MTAKIDMDSWLYPYNNQNDKLHALYEPRSIELIQDTLLQ